MRELSVKEMRDYMIGAAIFAQGQPEDFQKSLILIERMGKEDVRPKIVDSSEVPDDAIICQIWQRSGGGYEYTDKKISEFLGNLKTSYEERSFEKTYPETIGKVGVELSKSFSDEIYGYLTYCTSSSQGIVPMYISAMEGKPIVDADCAGTAMWPHLDELAGISYEALQIFCSPYGETLVLKNVPEKRAKLLLEYFHQICGCWFIGVANGLARYDEYKRCIVKKQISRMINVGSVVRRVREKGNDPVSAFIEEAGGYKLFRGEVGAFHLEKKGGLAEGYWVIRGTGEFSGHEYKIWFSMENRMSWFDGSPFVSIPDISAVVDSKTCESLSVLDHDHTKIADGMYKGRDVTVIGIEADHVWYELEGAIDSVNEKLREYGFSVGHRPMKELI